jgi:hypothetical protein
MKQPTVRRHGYVEFAADGQGEAGWRISRARGKTFLVEWCKVGALGFPITREREDEVIAVFPHTGGSISNASGANRVAERSIVIISPGPFSVSCDPGGSVILLSPIRNGMTERSTMNDADYDDAGPEAMLAVAVTSGTVRKMQIIQVDKIVPPKDKPRLKIVRSESMSVSWIEYSGLRDRTQLSPHDHLDFEQGSLAIQGTFVHHLRVPWGPDATQWREDIHVTAKPESLCVIPPRTIHTTEGEGNGHHILLDIFAPARADFAAHGWISNQDLYQIKS